ncbi:TIGR02300 family protein [Tranquillimonas rosea]|uniref:TIGR02300 family protein n=1 Tax=Tranquillimonas rosea TaxID=641238 RepID=A0A1H9SDQ3_9RHOB|nr:TIGR02300 family protein [Tranquillimonas rosea]SER83124.1 TIGR02300 family protein [Tranquillimonas rosea]
MPKEEWGTKRLCPTTGKRFYDLNADPVVSPYTGEVVPLETGKGSRTMLADKADKQSTKETEKSENDDSVLEDDSNNNVDLGDDVLEDDEDDDNVSLDDIADVSNEDDES